MGNRRRFGAVVAVLSGAALVGGCASGATSTSEGGAKPTRGGSLVIARSADATTFNTTTVHDNFSIFTTEQILEPLFMVSEDGKSVEPWLAKSYSVSADKLVYTVKLRTGVTFSDGTPLTAKDVKFSIDQSTKTAETGWGYINDPIKQVTVVDAHTVKFSLKYKFAPFLSVLSMFSNEIVPDQYGGRTAEKFYQDPVGTGPFLLGEWKKGRHLKLVRNEKYWQQGKPYLDSVQWNVVSDANTRKLQLQGNQIQIDEAPDWSSFDSLKSSPGITAKKFESTQSSNLAFNLTRKPFSDVHVRRAIAHAIDRKALVKAVLFGHGKPANSLLAPGTPYYDKDAPSPSYDLSKAKAELSKSSKPNGFSTSLLVRAGNGEALAVAQIIQSELKPLGIKVKINQLEAQTARQQQQDLKYDMALTGWTMDIPDPDQWTTFAVDPAGGAKSDFTGYNNPQAIALNKQARKESDPAKREQLYAKLQRLTGQDSFLAYLYYSPYGDAISNKVKGFHVTPLGNYHLENVYLAK